MLMSVGEFKKGGPASEREERKGKINTEKQNPKGFVGTQGWKG